MCGIAGEFAFQREQVEEYGEAFFEHLRGEFAFALYDR